MKRTVIFGLHAVQALLSKHPDRIQRLITLSGRQDQKIQKLLSIAKQHTIKIDSLPRQEMDQLAQHANHQGVIACCDEAKTYAEEDLKEMLAGRSQPVLLLILDTVQDPHNLGACLRSAEAAGVHAVIAPKDKAVGLTPTVRKVACGAAESLPFIQVTNLARTLRWLKDEGVWVYGAAAEAEQTLYQADFTRSTAIVMGAEGSGLRRLTREHCDLLLTIPMQGSTSSLNVSVATGIFLFEATRQRSCKQPPL